MIPLSVISHKEFHQRQIDYLQAIEPLVQERVKLRLLATTTLSISGHILHEQLPRELQQLDDNYLALIRDYQHYFFP